MARSRAFDAVIVGGGHNGLVAASYLARSGKKVAVIERRNLLGGAAVTEELFPGFKYSRASYVYSLFRPHIVQDLQLHRHGLKLLPRVPSSFTPQVDPHKPSLLLGGGAQADYDSIAQFSEADAKRYRQYNALLDRYSDAFRPLLDRPPPDLQALFSGPASSSEVASWWREWSANAKDAYAAAHAVGSLGRELPGFLEFLLAPASKTLDAWFQSDILKATLATDAVIGSLASPSTPQSSYVLLHHVMCGIWANVQGGMGALSGAIAASAREAGAEFFLDSSVKRILVSDPAGGRRNAQAAGAAEREGSAFDPPLAEATGVELDNGDIITAPIVIANAAPHTVFTRLLAHAPEALPGGLASSIDKSIGPSGCVKINVALDRLPDFLSRPNAARYEIPAAVSAYGRAGGPRSDVPELERALPHHRGTIHFETSVGQIEAAYADAVSGRPSTRPIIEMTIPTALDSTIAPPGKHVALLFCQYAPYRFGDGRGWDDVPGSREAFADSVFRVIEAHAPGFTASVLHRDILAPPDLERVFGLPRGNIFHAPMGLDALLWSRPARGAARYRVPSIRGLYLASAGTHPGGGVIGAPGYNCAQTVLRDQLA